MSEPLLYIVYVRDQCHTTVSAPVKMNTMWCLICLELIFSGLKILLFLFFCRQRHVFKGTFFIYVMAMDSSFLFDCQSMVRGSHLLQYYCHSSFPLGDPGTCEGRDSSRAMYTGHTVEQVDSFLSVNFYNRKAFHKNCENLCNKIKMPI